VAKAAAAAAAALVLAVAVVAAAAGAAVSRLPFVSFFLGGGTGGPPSRTALADVPPDYLDLYIRAAATCPGLDWTVLAAVGKIESDHGRSRLPGVIGGANHAGAVGPMQFLRPTWDRVVARHPPPPGGAAPPSPYNPHDAVFAAAALLCDSGARDGRDLRGALRAYGAADWYPSAVFVHADRYRGTPQIGADTPAGPAALQAVNYAQGQLGLPYLWGGDGPHEGGFDCSGLTRAAYAAAGVELPRTAQQQYDAGPAVPAGAPLLPGDLVFYGSDGNVHHVALYTGRGQMITAPGHGQVVKISPYRWAGDDYHGATRPAN
jgi:cell wall-associated NlpC family hydrolase